MTPIQQLFLGQGAKKKTYIDDVYNTYVYEGSGSARSINTGVDMTEGGLVWVKRRDAAQRHSLSDSVRGVTNAFWTERSDAQYNYSDGSVISSFNNNGFSLGDSSYVNGDNNTYTSWSFKESKGFFDIVTYTGTGSTQTISHSLGCVPGMIVIKCPSHAEGWVIYHRGTGTNAGASALFFTNGAANGHPNYWNDTMATSTHFTVKAAGESNDNGKTYVAYVFAGGEQRGNESVKFDGTEDNLNWGSNSNLAFGTGDFTIEFWVKMTTVQDTILLDMRPNSAATNGKYPLIHYNSNQIKYFTDSSDRIFSTPSFNANQWYHVAVSRSGTSTKMFLDGTQVGSTYSDSNDYLNGDTTLGSRASNTSYNLNGYISNFRITKSQALYTSNFTPSTTPLTTTSQGATANNVKILCCNDTQIENYTKSPNFITLNGNPTGDKSSPFSEPIDASSIFGESGSETVIKCGLYKGSGTAGNKDISLGFEPQYILIKRTDGTGNWRLFDSMRGIVTGGNDPFLQPNWDSLENTVTEVLEVTPTGFRLQTTDTNINGGGYSYVYMCIRRPDGYVGKPAELGTDVFTMVAGTPAANGNPTYISNGVRDFVIARQPATSENWNNFSRLTQGRNLFLNSTNVEAALSVHQADFNNGMVDATASDVANYQGWLWKRHAGFDVVSFVSVGGSGTSFNHSLGRVPEMMWFKNRDRASTSWFVYHKDLHASNPEKYKLELNSNGAVAGPVNDFFEYSGGAGITATTASGGGFFETGGGSGEKMLCLLFASVDGISKVGSYSGQTSTISVNLGFQPRFLFVKNITNSNTGWVTLDTTRGWGSGNDQYMYLNTTTAQASYELGAPTSTGFDMTGGLGEVNDNGSTYIYYAHA